jgi:hypothetical protein
MAEFFAMLQEGTRDARERFMAIPQLQRGIRGEISLATYIAFLVQAYHHVRHTVPLLMAVGSRLDANQEWLREAVTRYIEGQRGHQEWILSDLRACGTDPESHRHGIPHPATEIMVSYAWDTVQRRNPVGFFGMAYVLEGTSVQLAMQAAHAIRSALGLPQKAFSYLSSRGALDLDHMDFLRSLMNRIGGRDDRQAILHMANMMFGLYGEVFRNLPLD